MWLHVFEYKWIIPHKTWRQAAVWRVCFLLWSWLNCRLLTPLCWAMAANRPLPTPLPVNYNLTGTQRTTCGRTQTQHDGSEPFSWQLSGGTGTLASISFRNVSIRKKRNSVCLHSAMLERNATSHHEDAESRQHEGSDGSFKAGLPTRHDNSQRRCCKTKICFCFSASDVTDTCFRFTSVSRCVTFLTFLFTNTEKTLKDCEW